MRFWVWLFLAGAALNIVVGLPGWPAALAGHLNDPDSYMRLERIFQGVQAGHLTNFVARDGPGSGVLVEWSRLMDAALWALAAPVALFLGWKGALLFVGIATGPLIAGLLGLSLAFVAEPFVARRFLWLLPVASALLPALANYAGPGVVTHHVLLLALLALTAGCVARADRYDTAWNFLAGAAGGFAIWLTPEAMPFVLLCYGLPFLRWLQRPAGAGLAACGAGIFDVLCFGFALDPRPAATACRSPTGSRSSSCCSACVSCSRACCSGVWKNCPTPVCAAPPACSPPWCCWAPGWRCFRTCWPARTA